jgi:hypothetical protein
LVIDEVSMLNAEFFVFLALLSCVVRRNSAFFGGLKLFLCGDFLQLHPVGGTPIFSSDLWKNLILPCGLFTYLDRAHRFDGDEYAERRLLLLQDVRQGIVSQEVIQTISMLGRNDKHTALPSNSITLVHTNDRWRLLNQQVLEKLAGDEQTYVNITVRNDEVSIVPSSEYGYKLGSRVMSTVNRGLIHNGTMGKVIAWERRTRDLSSKMVQAWMTKQA